MNDPTTIQVTKPLLEKLKSAREYPKQSYKELIEKAVTNLVNSKRMDQYDKFIHEIQKEKMQELWDNPADNKRYG